MPPCVYQPDLVYRDGALVPGTLAVDAAGRLVDAAALPPGTETVRLAGRVAFPGLVNAHSHAFQRLIRGRTEFVPQGRPGDDFWSWREQMYRAAGSLDPMGSMWRAGRRSSRWRSAG
jgi:formimidoylglutamate deiminase